MRLATWNVNSLKARLPRVEEWIAYAQPDVLCMQETKLSDDAFPVMPFSALGYEVAYHGEGRWNGVAIASRIGLEDVQAGFSPAPEPDDPDSAEARMMSATCGGVRVASLYVPNGRSLDHEHYKFKLRWLARVKQWVTENHEPSDPLVLTGDFNIAPDDRDVYAPAKFKDATHVSEPERNALRELCEWGLVDTFRQLYEDPNLYTWWDYRAGDFHQGRGLRIDLMLVTEPLAKNLVWGLVDRNARKGPKDAPPSDHAPMLMDFDL